MARWRYAQWDGTQGAEWEADDLLRKLGDDLLYHGDVHAALRRLMREGFTGPGHERVAGLRELLERLRGQRSRRLARQGLGQPLAPMARELREIVALERSEIAGRPDAAERGLHLDLLPPDPVGQIESLHGYDFASGEAARRFDELVERLRSELLRAQFHRMAGALPATTPQDRRRLAEMLEALNELVAMREAGLPTDAAFAQFMDAYGGFFPDRPATLDQLLERLAQQMAAFEAAVAAMSPEQRAALRELAEALLAEAGLAAQVARLGQYLQAAYPGAGWGPGYGLRGRGGLGLAGAAELMGELGALDRLEALLEGAPSPGALADVDLEEVARLLGHDAADAMARLSRVARDLEAAGVVEARAGRMELTPRGLRRVGQQALADLFERLAADRIDLHAVQPPGPGHDRLHETRPYQFGDPLNLDIGRTVANALRRQGGGVPVRLRPEDFEVERTETLTRTATVLALDLSLSMPMRDNFLAAKKVAVALHTLITSRFPRDYLGLVAFSDVARELKAAELPEVSWDFGFGTNLQHALLIARRLLAGQAGSRQVVVITDGEPTAHLEPGRPEPFVSYPPAPETVEATLAEVARCTRAGITINTFMLDATPHLRDFVDKLTRLNRGRAFFATPEELGRYVLVNFIGQKRAARR